MVAGGTRTPCNPNNDNKINRTFTGRTPLSYGYAYNTKLLMVRYLP
nr:MAG TPA: hypothetical protein [Bacteriophage sp.]